MQGPTAPSTGANLSVVDAFRESAASAAKRKPSTLSSPRTAIDLRLLDALRGFAAIYVVAGHATELLWTAAHPGAREGLVAAVYSALTAYAPVAVILFFLISGFCIHYRQANLLASTPTGVRPSNLLNLRSFATRRFRRLYPALAFALALTAVCDAIGHAINPVFYLEPHPEIGWTAFSYSAATLLGNLAFQAQFIVPTFGTDSPLWSLSYEFWFYALYPLLLAVSVRRGSFGMLGLAAGGAVLGLAASRWNGVWVTYLFIDWLIWTMGAVIAEAYVGRIHLPNLKWAALASAVALGMFIPLLPYYDGGRGQGRDLLWGGALALLLAYLLIEPNPRIASVIKSICRVSWLGDFSYSLYVAHVPWLALFSAWWLSARVEALRGPQLVAVGILSSVAVGVACWYFVERRFIDRRVRQTAPVTASPPGVDRVGAAARGWVASG